MTRSMAWERKLALASAVCAAWCMSTAMICQAADDAAASQDTFSCAETLLPCQEYVNKAGQNAKPSSSCCEPLGKALATEKRCICSITENEGFLHSLNVTKEEFQSVSARCGLKVDEGYCKEYSNSTAAHTTIVNPIERVTSSSATHAWSSLAKETAPIMLSVFGMWFLRGLYI